jgi:hypothetical protein
MQNGIHAPRRLLVPEGILNIFPKRFSKNAMGIIRF